MSRKNNGAKCAAVDSALIASLRDSGILESADTGFAEFAVRNFADDDCVYYSALALVWAARNQHVCIDYRKGGLLFTGDDEGGSSAGELREIALSAITEASKSPKAPFFSEVIPPHEAGSAQTPAVFFKGRLYLNKFYNYERLIASKLAERMHAVTHDSGLLASGVAELFPAGSDERQRAAALNAAQSSFSVISGGPGTGKTSTVIKIALLHIEQLLADTRIPRILLCAPTGKAALRLYNALGRGSGEYRTNDRYAKYLQYLPDADHTLTIHRALPLLAEYTPTLVIVDETSMVDTLLLYRLLSSLGADASIIFLGDRDQLSSVQSGSVMADLCTLDDISPRAKGRINMLEKSYRFSGECGIGRAAALIRSGDANGFLDFLKSGDSQLALITPGAKGYHESVRFAIESMAGSCRDFAAFSQTDDDAAAILQFEKYRVLCARRSGPWGVTGINDAIEELLSEEGYINPSQGFYHNMPLLILKNDYRRNLYNGDTGLVRKNGESLHFTVAADGEVRRFNPAFLSDTQKVFAMTIHKSQGSEYDGCLIVLPAEDSPLLTRELLYTALTRARHRAVILASEEILHVCIARQTERMSGLTAFF